MKSIKQYIKSILWRRMNRENETILAGDHFPLKKVSVGKMTYGHIKAISSGVEGERLEIGSFCSIADEVVFLLSGEHSTNTILSYPVRYKIKGELETKTKGPIIVEDDVWIGYGATILSGVRLGRGCVVAARSLVSRDVEPYSIVGGIPAKQIKYRFPNDIRKRLCSINFEHIDSTLINQNLSLFVEPLNEEVLEHIEICVSDI